MLTSKSTSIPFEWPVVHRNPNTGCEASVCLSSPNIATADCVKRNAQLVTRNRSDTAKKEV